MRRSSPAIATSSIVLVLCASIVKPIGVVLPNEPSALSAACEWVRDHRAYSKPTLGYVACGFTQASLKDGVWSVIAPTCRTCIGGGMILLLERRTGRVIQLIVGQ